MKNIFKIYFRDLKKIFTNSMAIVLAVGLAVLPSLYAWFNIYANWDPYGSTGNMMVAVVNDDEGATYRDITIDVGSQIVTNLKGNDAINWQFVSKDEALSGIESGKYYAGIEIPKGFSKSLTSIVTSNFEQPQITYYANEKKNAIATKITDKVVQTVQTSVNESFVTTVVGMINKILGSIVEESQATGVNVFDDLQTEISNANDSVMAIQGTLDGFQKVMKLLGDLDPSMNENDLANLLNNTTLLLDDAQDMIGLAQSSADTVLGALGTAIDGGVGTLNSAANTVTSVGGTITSAGVTAINNASSDVANLKNNIDKICETLTQINSSLSSPISEIDSIVARLSSVSQTLDGIIASLNSIADGDYSGSVNDVANMLTGAANTLEGIKKDYTNIVQPKITSAVKTLTASLTDIANLLSALDKDMPEVKNVFSTLKDGMSAGDDMITSVSTLLKNATNMLSDLSDKLQKLANSDVINAIVNITSNNTAELGEFLACPVKVNTDKIYGIENYGSAMAPFYSTLAIWVGSMFLVAVMKPDVKKKKEIGRVKPYQEFFGRGLTFMSFSIIQTAIICLGDLLFFKIQCYHPVKFMIAGILSAVVYSFFIYALTYTLGDIGKSLAIIMLVLQIGGSGGTFPIDVTPTLFVTINPFLPFTFTIEAMRECICGLYQNAFWIWLLKLVVYFVAALVIGLLVKPIVKNPLRFFTKQVEKTDLF